MKALLVVPILLAAPLGADAAEPPVLTMLELKLKGRIGDKFIDKRVRVAHPQGWEGDVEPDRRSIYLYGPDGMGEILIAALAHPAEIENFLMRLKKRHPSTVPSPPQYIEVPGIDEQKGERATRFEITGRELGELVTIDRGEVIVLFATFVKPNAWAGLKPIMARSYPTVEVIDKLAGSNVDPKKTSP